MSPDDLNTAELSTDLRFDSIVDALAAIRNGESIVVVADENRENGGALVCAAQFATRDMIRLLGTEARGAACRAREGEGRL